MTPIRKGTPPDDIIAAIDHATGCQQCGKDLSGSVSDDFCKEECQRAWQAANVARVRPGDDVLTYALELDTSGFAAAVEQATNEVRALAASMTMSTGLWADLVNAYRLVTEEGRPPRPPATHFTVNADGTLTQNLPLDARHEAVRAVRANAESWLHHRVVEPFQAP